MKPLSVTETGIVPKSPEEVFDALMHDWQLVREAGDEVVAERPHLVEFIDNDSGMSGVVRIELAARNEGTSATVTVSLQPRGRIWRLIPDFAHRRLCRESARVIMSDLKKL